LNFLPQQRRSRAHIPHRATPRPKIVPWHRVLCGSGLTTGEAPPGCLPVAGISLTLQLSPPYTQQASSSQGLLLDLDDRAPRPPPAPKSETPLPRTHIPIMEIPSRTSRSPYTPTASSGHDGHMHLSRADLGSLAGTKGALRSLHPPFSLPCLIGISVHPHAARRYSASLRHLRTVGLLSIAHTTSRGISLPCLN